MGGFTAKSVWHRKCRLLGIFLAVAITCDLVGGGAAQFYSETKSPVNTDKDCFCEVIQHIIMPNIRFCAHSKEKWSYSVFAELFLPLCGVLNVNESKSADCDHTFTFRLLAKC